MTAWSYDWFPVPGQAVFDRTVQKVTAVSRAPGNLDLFIVGNGGHVWSTFWNDQGGWSQDWFSLPGQAVFDLAVQKVTAVSRAPGNLDLFIVGNDSHVWSTFWNDQAGWNQDWFPLPGQAMFDLHSQHVATVSRAHGNLDLFIVGNDGHVWSTFWNDQAGWNQDWFPLPGQAVFDLHSQQVAGVSRAHGNLDLFIVGNDGHVWSTFWNDQAGWNQDWFPLPGQAVFDRTVQKVTAVSRAPGNLDLFIVGNDSHVWSSFWNDQVGWNQDWFPLPGQAVFDIHSQHVAVVSRTSGSIDLFIVGNDGHVWSTFWNDQAGWNQDWFPLPSEAVFDRSIQQVAAVSRASSNLDLFIIGNENHVWSTYWGAAEVTMTKLIDNGPLGAKVTMVVVGDGFTAWDQDTYNRHVDSLLTNGLFTHDFYAVNRSAFNLVRLNVSSKHSGVSTKTYDSNGNVSASAIQDTYFGATFNGDWAHCWVEDGPDTVQRLTDLLNKWVLDRHLVVLLLNNPGFGGCGGGGRLTLPLGVSWSTVAHECGHALGGLADEYHQQNNAYSDEEPGQANATANTDRATLKWGWAIAATTLVPTGSDDYTPPKPAGWDDNQGVGLFEGGSANFATGIYRPVIDCRMNTNNPPFCPVCAAAMSAQTHPFLGNAPEGTGTSTIGSSTASDGYVRMHVRMHDGILSLQDAQTVEGPLVQPTTLAYGLVHEVLVDGRQVSIGAHPDANISRSFEEPGHGPGTHHIHDLPTIDLIVRVPTAALRGADPSKVMINVYHVQEHPSTLLAPFAILAHQPTLKLDSRATLILDQISIPEALRTLMVTK